MRGKLEGVWRGIYSICPMLNGLGIPHITHLGCKKLPPSGLGSRSLENKVFLGGEGRQCLAREAGWELEKELVQQENHSEGVVAEGF